VINGRVDLILRAKRNSLQQHKSRNVPGEKNQSRRGHPHIAKNVSKGLKPEVIKQNTIGHVGGGYTHIV
jgi:hypothetical protein